MSCSYLKHTAHINAELSTFPFFLEVEKMKKIIKAILAVITEIILVGLPIVAVLFIDYLITAPENNKYQEELWHAKTIVAEEIGYSGMLDTKHFQIWSDGTYTIIKQEKFKLPSIEGEGRFKNPEAFKAIRRAYEHNDNIVNMALLRVIIGVIVFYLAGFFSLCIYSLLEKPLFSSAKPS